MIIDWAADRPRPDRATGFPIGTIPPVGVDVFCAALLNSQPMGFYGPAQIVRDAIQHGVDVQPVCINASRWDCTLAWISQTLLVHRGGESENMLCCNNFSWIQERPDADRVYAEAVCI